MVKSTDQWQTSLLTSLNPWNQSKVVKEGLLMAIKDYRDESRKSWGYDDQDGRSGTLNIDRIQLGAILRIADATEKMSADRVRLERDLDFYKRQSKSKSEEIDALRRSRASYVGKLRATKEALRLANEEIKSIKGGSSNG
ncbi:hypothetical protein [Sphingobacterium suaedae]|uniref:Uncharacterized protein n=1 Tax=Sphingobacterium suaedae TaxID=1686402 RepID=A0ABW5KIC5_9SPHI